MFVDYIYVIHSIKYTWILLCPLLFAFRMYQFFGFNIVDIAITPSNQVLSNLGIMVGHPIPYPTFRLSKIVKGLHCLLDLRRSRLDQGLEETFSDVGWLSPERT